MEFSLRDEEKVKIKSGNTVSTTQTGKNQKRREVFLKIDQDGMEWIIFNIDFGNKPTKRRR